MLQVNAPVVLDRTTLASGLEGTPYLKVQSMS